MKQPDWKNNILVFYKQGDQDVEFGGYRHNEPVAYIDPEEWLSNCGFIPTIGDNNKDLVAFASLLLPRSELQTIKDVIKSNLENRLKEVGNPRKENGVMVEDIKCQMGRTLLDDSLPIFASIKEDWLAKDTLVEPIKVGISDVPALMISVSSADINNKPKIIDKNAWTNGQKTFGSGGDYSLRSTAYADIGTPTANFTSIQISDITDTSVALINGFDFSNYTFSEDGQDYITYLPAEIYIYPSIYLSDGVLIYKNLNLVSTAQHYPARMFQIHTIGVTGLIRVSDCKIDSTNYYTTSGLMIWSNSSVEIWNVMFKINRAGSGLDTSQLYDEGNAKIENCVFDMCNGASTPGIMVSTGQTIRNCVFINCSTNVSDAFNNAVAISCSTDDGNIGTSTEFGSICNINSNDEFESIVLSASNAYRLTSTSQLIDTGSAPDISNNITGFYGDERPGFDSAYSIGSDENPEILNLSLSADLQTLWFSAIDPSIVAVSATVIDGYVAYSVCPSCPTDIQTGSGTITILSGVAYFSVAQTNSLMGVGMEISYNDGTNRKCYVWSKINTSIWNVTKPTGGVPPNCTDATITAITAAYPSLSNFILGFSDADHLNSKSLTSAGANLNLYVPCYCEQSSAYTPDVSGLKMANNNVISGDSTHSLYVYSPTNTSSECNLSMFPTSPKWDDTKYRLLIPETNNECIIKGSSVKVFLTTHHLQIKSYTPEAVGLPPVVFDVAGLSEELETTTIHSCICVMHGPTGQSFGSSVVRAAGGPSNNTFVCYNNIIIYVGEPNRTNTGSLVTSSTGWISYIYGNTLYGNNRISTAFSNGSLSVVRNNVFLGYIAYTDTPGIGTVDTNLFNCSFAGASFFTGQSYANLFKDVSNSDPQYWDWTPKNGSDILGHGITLGTPYNTDIMGISRPSGGINYCLGAVELSETQVRFNLITNSVQILINGVWKTIYDANFKNFSNVFMGQPMQFKTNVESNNLDYTHMGQPISRQQWNKQILVNGVWKQIDSESVLSNAI